MYVFGPFVLPIALNSNLTLENILILILFGIYFLLPANLLIYGINDINDYETDILNDKKNGYEELVENTDKEKKFLIKYITLTNIPFLILAIFLLPKISLIYLFLFLLTSWQYSAKPIRAKAKPFLDSIVSGVLYIMPAGISYGLLFSKSLPTDVLIAGIIWSVSMHAYSAVPDINADKQAGLKTGATMLGKQTMLVLCCLLFLVSATIGFKYIGAISIIGFAFYLYLIIWSIKIKTPEGVLKVYKIFPYVNTFVGGLIFLSLLIKSL